MSYDIVIRNGTVIDGSGAPGFLSDVGIKDGKIAGFGCIRDGAAQTIDAEGLVVTPGFIDVHTHMDAQIFWDPMGTGSCWHGVTSVVMGNCGFTLAPCRPGDADFLKHSLESVEDISASVMDAGIDWTWGSYPDYLERISRLPKGINYGGYIGHSPLRRYVMGERSSTQQATPDDVEAMRAELAEALRAGALGFTTSRSAAHLTPERLPVPSRMASWEEVQALVQVMDDLNAGVFEIAAGGLDRLRDLSLDTRVPVSFGLIAPLSSPEYQERMLATMSQSAERGGRIVGQAHSRGVSTLWSFQTNLPYFHLPLWRDLRGRPAAEVKAALTDPATRAKLIEIANNPPPATEPRGGGEAAIPDRAGYRAVHVYTDPTGPNPSLLDLAEQQGKDPVEVLIDHLVATDLDGFFQQDLSTMDEEIVLKSILHPNSVVTFSDSGAHVSQIVDCNLQTYFLAYWVRRRQALSLEAAIRKLTFDLSRHWGISNRGLLREGMAADVAVFDPAIVAPVMPEVAHDLPAGGTRIIQKARGFHTMIVNGVVTLRDGARPTGDFPGQMLLGPLAR